MLDDRQNGSRRVADWQGSAPRAGPFFDISDFYAQKTSASRNSDERNLSTTQKTA
ncbi:MAG TPA: hypothetical protein VFI31_25070 [Pirellulales bacterium]|nr:hypothetical protein [Pirellulales bacterium]